MNRKTIFGLCVLVLTVSLFSTQASAELKFKGGIIERLRHEYWKNNRDMENHNYDGSDLNFFRIKTSAWGRIDYDENAGLFVKLTNENKAYAFYGASADKDYHYDIDEVVFDNLYLDFKKIARQPLDLRLGRQDFIGVYGENFLFADGTPRDGSRTLYFDALKATWNIDEKNSLDLLYIQNDMTDNHLPVVNKTKGNLVLNDTDETAYGIYHKSEAFKNLRWENYYIFKREGNEGTGTSAKPMFRHKTRLNTLGSFIKYSFSPWTLRVQLADQFGEYGLEDRQGLGGYIFVDRELKDILWEPTLTLGVLYLSGDDPNTSKNEGWDPLFSRCALNSEIIAIAFTGESAAGYWTNLQMYRAIFSLKPRKKMKLNFIYSFLRANQLVPANAAYSFSGSGKDRGHLFQAKAEYAFNKNISGCLLGEYFSPKNFYTASADPAIFFRTELEIKF